MMVWKEQGWEVGGGRKGEEWELGGGRGGGRWEGTPWPRFSTTNLLE